MSHQRGTSPECGCLWPSVPIGCPQKPGRADLYVRIRLLFCFDPRVLAWVTLQLFSFPRGKVWIACSDRHHSQCGGPRVWEWPGERGRRRGGKNEETQTQNYPDQEAGVLARPLKLNWHPDEVFWIILTRRNLLLWKRPSHNFGDGSLWLLWQKFHVAQKRIEALSSGSNAAYQSMSMAPGNVLSQSLSLGWSHKDFWERLEKTNNDSVLYSLFSGRFCFCQG